MPTVGSKGDFSPEAINDALKQVETSLVTSCGTAVTSKKVKKLQKKKSQVKKTVATTKSGIHSVMTNLETSFKGKYGKEAKTTFETSGKKLASFSQ